MTDWLKATYGDPCIECGFGWDLSRQEAEALVAGLPARLSAILRTATGHEKLPGLEWSVGSYVAHISDNLHIWAERVAGVTLGADPAVPRYDEAALGAARGYAALSLEGVLWSLERAVRDWLEAIRAAPVDLRLDHPDRGELAVDDVVL
ncbi:MAG: DinB family protein, partial [Acidimicrobiales bacterium]